MLRPTLLFHIGTHKTGTTAIQQTLGENRDMLRAAGIWYPELRPAFPTDSNAHHSVAHALATPRERQRKSLREFWWTLQTTARRYDRTLLSSESVMRHYLGPRVEGDVEAWFRQHEQYLRRLRLYLTGFRTSVIIYYRQPHSFAESLYKENLANAKSTLDMSFDWFLADRAFRFDYARQIDLYRKVFAGVEVRQYEAEASGGLVRGFFKGLGLTEPESAASGRSVRTSISNPAAVWLSRQVEDTSARQRRSMVYYAASDPDGLFAEGRRSTLWGEAQREAFAERYRGTFDLEVMRGLPRVPEASTTVWTDEMQTAADTGFAAWAEANADRLKRRNALKLAFYQPDPPDEV